MQSVTAQSLFLISYLLIVFGGGVGVGVVIMSWPPRRPKR